MPNRVPTLHTVAVITATLALAACGGTSDVHTNAADEPPLGQIPNVMSSADLPALPLAAYSTTTKQLQQTQQAIRLLGRQCMARHGFDWHGSDPTNMPDLEKDGARRYGVIDLRVAERQGYRWNPPTVGPPPAPKGSLPDPSPAELLAWSGKTPSGNGADMGKPPPAPAGSCLAEVTARLEQGATDTADPALVQKLDHDAWSRVGADSRVVAAQAGWSNCMRSHNYNFKTDGEAHRSRPSTPTATPAEIALATVDVRCKQQTNLVGISYAVEAAYQKRLIEENSEQMAAVQRNEAIEERNIAAILGQG